jgi:hypothetical protein
VFSSFGLADQPANAGDRQHDDRAGQNKRTHPATDIDEPVKHRLAEFAEANPKFQGIEADEGQNQPYPRDTTELS